MLEIQAEPRTLFDEATQTFKEIPGARLRLEHSLLSLSKWESKWEKPFMVADDKTTDELFDYIRCMSVDRDPPMDVIRSLSPQNIAKINEYIARRATATTFSEPSRGASRAVVTSEVVYGWMVAFNIPWEAQKWHLNRLLTLIKVCEQQQNPKKTKRSPMKYEEKMALNLARQRKLGTHG